MTDNKEIIRYTSAETSRKVKKELTKKFACTFSVTCKHFSLRIKWENGPAVAEVERFVWQYEGATLEQNGGDMIKAHKSYPVIDGKQVDFGIDYIFTERNFSEEAEAQVNAYVAKTFGNIPDYEKSRRVYRVRQDANAKDFANLDALRLY